MKNNQNNTLIAAILFAAIIIGGSLVYLGSRFVDKGSTDDLNAAITKGIEEYVQTQQAGSEQAARIAETVPNNIEDNDASMGDQDAAISLIEFSDYECPFCKRNFTNNYEKIKEKYVNTGKVKMTYRDFPLNFHDPLATQEAMAAECVREQAGDEKYFAYHDLIFRTTVSNGNGMEKSQLYDLAEQVGVDRTEFTDCLDSEKFKSEIAKDIDDGQKSGINGTPGFIILAKKDQTKVDALKALEIVQQGQYINQYIETEDGERMGMRVSGAQDLSSFESIFELLLN